MLSGSGIFAVKGVDGALGDFEPRRQVLRDRGSEMDRRAGVLVAVSVVDIGGRIDDFDERRIGDKHVPEAFEAAAQRGT